MLDFVQITKALADEPRLRALVALRRRSLCVSEIVELLRLAPSTVSRHMAILRLAGLVVARREGRCVRFEVPGPEAPRVIRDAIAWVEESLANTSLILDDADRLEGIHAPDEERACACATSG
jgi:ArsR family transcriptional regulator